MRGRFDLWAPRPGRVRLSVGEDVVEFPSAAVAGKRPARSRALGSVPPFAPLGPQVSS